MKHDIKKITDVIDALLGPGGCPWDQKQTPASLCDYLLEEAYELADAIRSNDPAGAMEELGDLLFILLFIARLYADQGDFNLDQAMQANAEKMIRRHPHVFESLEINGREELLRNWEKIKRQEKQDENKPQGTFSSLPKGLPPLLKAYRIHSKAARVGFTWETDQDMEAQLESEHREWTKAVESGNQKQMEEEFGDYIFTLAELGRRKGIKANAALNLSNLKFLDRFEKMEKLAKTQNTELTNLSLNQMNQLWEKVKEEEKNIKGASGGRGE